MTIFRKLVAHSALSAVLLAGVAIAQDDHHDDHGGQQDQHGQQDNHGGQQDNHGYVRHDEWHKGARISHDDWNRGQVVDYRSHHLRTPPRGYQWRQVDGNYVLAAVATGVIASAIMAASAR